MKSLMSLVSPARHLSVHFVNNNMEIKSMLQFNAIFVEYGTAKIVCALVRDIILEQNRVTLNALQFVSNVMINF